LVQSVSVFVVSTLTREKVYVLGFPVGGNDLSITEGVVSRVEVQSYSHSHARALAVTVDAAINSGNSGGPVLSQLTGGLVGVAFQGYAGSSVENQGHMGRVVCSFA
jgi:S1-C subfamily serine protease